MDIIGVTGRKGHGKDTVAAVAIERQYVHLRFADPLKAMLRAYYRAHYVDDPTIRRKLEGDLKEVPCEHLGGKTPRYAMQTLGTEWGRDCMGREFWTESLKRRAPGFQKVVVPDVRFDNEVAAIHELGGSVIRVDASQRVPANEFSNHPSETGVDALFVDWEVDNNGSMDTLREEIHRLPIFRAVNA